MPRARAGLAPSAVQAPPERGAQSAPTVAPPLGTGKLLRVVLAIMAVGCASMALVFVLARRTAVDRAGTEATALAELIAAHLDVRTERGDRPAVLKSLWSRLQRHVPESALSTVSADGKIALQTSRPADVGTDVGGVMLRSDVPGERLTVTDLIASRRSGYGWAPISGGSELVAYAYSGALPGLVGVHVPAWTISAATRDAAIPAVGALAFLVFAIVPFALLHLGRTSSLASDRVQQTLGTLRDDEEQSRRILDEAADALLVYGGDGRIVSANRQAMRALGYSREELLHLSMSQIDAEKDPAALRGLTDRIEQERSLTVDRAFRRRNGSFLPVEVRFTRLDVGGVSRIVASARDIAERQRAVDALRESEQRLRSVVSNAPLILFAFDRDGYFTLSEGKRLDAFGVFPGGLVGRSFYDVYREYPRLLRNAQRALAGEVFASVVEVNGVMLDTWYTPTRSSGGDVTGVIGVATDITDRLQVQATLRKSEERFRQMADTIREVFWMMDAAVLQPLYVSPAFEEMFGATVKSVFEDPRSVLEFLSPENRRRAIAVDHQKGFDEEFAVHRWDGSTRWIRVRGFPIHDEFGKVYRIAGTADDVTERKLAGEELARVRDEALEASRLKSAFLANISHEVRTPLNVILGFNAVIADHLTDLGDDAHAAMLERIARAGKRLMGTIDGVLNLSKFETGGFEVRPVKLPLVSVLQEMIADYRVLAEEKGLALSLRVDEPDATVVFDEYCFTQSMNNLLDNAIKFTEKGEISVRLYRDAGGLALDIRDTGVGIDESYRPRLFEAFTQEDASYTRRFEGPGLGLALTKKFLDANLAEITVRSEKGLGTVFTVRFLTGEVPQPAPSLTHITTGGGAAAVAPQDEQKKTLLVVEDDPDTQAYMRTVLGWRYNVLLAGTGEMARLHLAENPDTRIILMDLQLKGNENGLDLTQQLRSQKLWKEVPIIAVTAHAFPEDRMKAMAAGCTAYLPKPFDKKVLLAMIQQLIA
ncbi:MAG: hypothetical protein QOD06_3496 [Candidatus Binatota bacterium]|nr:hypothetical protein [Candidatus Binatota bacterium]